MRYFPLVIKTKADVDDLIEIKRAVMLWLWTKEQHESRYAEHRALLHQLGNDAWHSGLLERLLQGQEPEKEPPHE